MIHLEKKFKRSKRINRFKLSLDEAIRFFYNINSYDFSICDFYVLYSDKKEELENLFNVFNKEYFIPVEQEIKVYMANPAIGKPERMRGISVAALENFRQKIKKTFPDYFVEFVLGGDNFEIQMFFRGGELRFFIVCNYLLEILSCNALVGKNQIISISHTNNIVNKINRIFLKQRYYYRLKKYGRKRKNELHREKSRTASNTSLSKSKD